MTTLGSQQAIVVTWFRIKFDAKLKLQVILTTRIRSRSSWSLKVSHQVNSA